MIRWTYLDTSAAVKLFRHEEHSDALERWLHEHPEGRPLTSDLARTELRCALTAAQVDEEAKQRAEIWIVHAALIRLTPQLCDSAGKLGPQVRLRSLDALHVAAALQMESALTAFIAYDKRLVDAAAANGLPVVSPEDG